MPGQAASKQIEKFLERNVEKVVAEHDQQVREQAARLEQQIVVTSRKLRADWIELAGHLYRFYEIRGWHELGYENFTEWLRDPRFDIRDSEAYRLIQAYREFVVLRGVDPATLARAHWSKLQLAIPAVRRNQVEPTRAIADVEALNYDDLRERYTRHGGLHGDDIDGKAIEPDDWVWERCQACGSMYKRKVSP